MIKENDKVIFFVSEDWYFFSHRFGLAKAIKKSGYSVTLITNVSSDLQKTIESAGIEVIPLRFFKRSSINPIREIFCMIELFIIYNREKPQISHHVALKPSLYGSFISRILRIKKTVNAIGGLGFIFSSQSLKARIIRPLLLLAIHLLFRNEGSKVVLQNKQDVQFMRERAGLKERDINFIPGVGVDLKRFNEAKLSTKPPIVMLAARMISEKGISEFVQAANFLKQKGFDARFVLVGKPDHENPLAISEKQLLSWDNDGVVEWWKFSNDMPKALSKASIVCLPSFYNEGIPKVLMEAAACGKASITTNTPGCRDVVEHEITGIHIPPRNIDALIHAIERLLLNPNLCKKMGAKARVKAENEFDEKLFNNRHLELYLSFRN